MAFKHLSQYLQYLLFRLCVASLNIVPFNAALLFSNRLGRFILRFNRHRMGVTRFNLKQAFGSRKSDAEIESMINEINGRLLEIGVEFARIPRLTRSVPVRNPERIWDGLRAGKGAVLLVSHLGNWELNAIGGGAEGYPIHAVGRPSTNPYVEAYIQRIRGKTGLKTIKKFGSVSDVSRLLKESQAICLPMDQRVKGGEPVAFLGQTAYFSTLPALLALRYGASVIPCFIYREPGPRYFIQVNPPFEILQGKDLRSTLHLNTQNFARCIEEEILKDPSHWVLWRHNIWKD